MRNGDGVMGQAVMLAASWTCRVRERLDEQRGATAVEYAILASLVAAAIAIAVSAFGQAVADLFSRGAAMFD